MPLSLIYLLFTQPLVTGVFVQITVLTNDSQQRHGLHINDQADVSRASVIAERESVIIMTHTKVLSATTL